MPPGTKIVEKTPLEIMAESLTEVEVEKGFKLSVNAVHHIPFAEEASLNGLFFESKLIERSCSITEWESLVNNPVLLVKAPLSGVGSLQLENLGYLVVNKFKVKKVSRNQKYLDYSLSAKYQPNLEGLMLALCVAFPPHKKFNPLTIAHLFAWDEELVNLLFKQAKAEKLVEFKDDFSASFTSKFSDEYMGKYSVHEEHKKCAWMSSESLGKIYKGWGEVDIKDYKTYEDKVAEYLGYEIGTASPNGGIVCVSIADFGANKAWSISTESLDYRLGKDWNEDRYHDANFHIAIAKIFVDSFFVNSRLDCRFFLC